MIQKHNGSPLGPIHLFSEKIHTSSVRVFLNNFLIKVCFEKSDLLTDFVLPKRRSNDAGVWPGAILFNNKFRQKLKHKKQKKWILTKVQELWENFVQLSQALTRTFNFNWDLLFIGKHMKNICDNWCVCQFGTSYLMFKDYRRYQSINGQTY